MSIYTLLKILIGVIFCLLALQTYICLGYIGCMFGICLLLLSVVFNLFAGAEPQGNIPVAQGTSVQCNSIVGCKRQHLI